VSAIVVTIRYGNCDECDWSGSWCDTVAQATEEVDQHNATEHGDAERQAGLS
jgi:hypothetical protein